MKTHTYSSKPLPLMHMNTEKQHLPSVSFVETCLWLHYSYSNNRQSNTKKHNMDNIVLDNTGDKQPST